MKLLEQDPSINTAQLYEKFDNYTHSLQKLHLDVDMSRGKTNEEQRLEE